MNKKILTPEKFLLSRGIKLNATSLISYISYKMRQPDLCKLLEDYANEKIKEIKQ